MKDKLYQYTAWLALFIGIIAILYFGRAFLIPLAFSLVIATLLKPLLYKLLGWGAPEWLAITGSVLAFVLAIGGIVLLMVIQVKSVTKDWPQIQEKAEEIRSNTQTYISEQFNVSKETQDKKMEQVLKQAQSSVGYFFGSALTFVSNAFLSIIYIVLFLMQRRRFLEFGRRIAPAGDRKKMADAIREAADVSGDYLMGKLKIMGILAVVYAIGFMIGGVKFGILLAVEAAIFTLIPYVGNLIGGGIAVVFAMVSGGGTSGALVVVAVMTLAQLLENYLLQPVIVGDEVDLNPWATIVVVVAFGMLWGVIGAVIALPLVGMFKVFADRFEPLQPLGFLLGKEPVKQKK